MKSHKIVFILFLAFALSSYSDTSFKKKGIKFFKGSWGEALQKAKEEDKFIFVDFYATWCGQCKKIKRTSFKDSKVGDYYNKNFINVSINAESREGIKIATQIWCFFIPDSYHYRLQWKEEDKNYWI